MTADFSFADWPPQLSREEIETLTLYATTYALAHGLLYLPPATPQPPAPTSAIHAPISLFPSPVPRKQFELVRRLRTPYNVLYSRIAMDIEFLDRVMGAEQGVGRADEFVGNLWRRWKSLRDVGPPAQHLQLGIFRSDYLLHETQGHVSIKQVEFNTISSSFGALSERTAAMHSYLLAQTGYFDKSPHLTESNLPPNQTTSGVVEGMAAAHGAYGVPGASILFVVQAGERNVFDQRWLEYELLEKHSIRVIRQTLDQLAESSSLDVKTQALYIAPQAGLFSDLSPVEIAVVYFRAGYAPSDYPTARHYDTRLRLDGSRAINCPSIALQLAGGKKVQEVLTQPGVVESFLCDEEKWGEVVFSKKDVDELKETFMEMWGLDHDDGAGNASHTESSGVRRARDKALSLVLKPQREGGGNNIYKSDVSPFLDKLAPEERAGWIAMELITPPQGAANYLVRAGSGTEGAVHSEVISELGIFGWSLFGRKEHQKGYIEEKEAGWLLRTKGKDSNEGGVAAGFSVLDSVLLVD